MAKDVSIQIKINDNLQDVTIDAESLGKAIDEVVGKTENLNTSIVRLGSLSQIAEAAASAFGQLNDVFKDLTDAYAAQSIAETRLAQAMSNTMGATVEEVQSIKDLCSAQQQLGVIGDEVQLAAAQELATYLEYPDSLRAIIPVMNDMAAQQYGLGASAESVTQIATMLGKVMNGQTEALSRYGYKFTEAQKQILQFGTESERAAVLVDVVSESVGGMNAALAQTPAGKMQQMANTFGDWKEQLGKTAQSIMPVVTGFNQLAQGLTTLSKLKTAFIALADSAGFAKVESLAMAVAHKTQAAAARMLGVSEGAAATATGMLRVQIIALQAAITLGLSLAITGVIELITRLIGRSREAADAVEEVDEATEAFTRTSKDARGEIAMFQVELQDIIKHHKDDAQKVEELNQKYGESFGYYKTAEDWYKVLTEKSEAYCRQLGFEAQARVIASQKAAKILEQEAIQQQMLEMQKNGTDQKKHFGLVHDYEGKVAGWGTEYRDTDVYAGLKQQLQDIGNEITDLDGKFQTCTENMIAAGEDLKSGLENAAGASPMGGKPSGGGSIVSNLAEDIQKYREAVQRAVEVNQSLGSSHTNMEAKVSAMKSGLTSLIQKYGATDEAVKQLIEDYRKMPGVAAALPKLEDFTKKTTGLVGERPADEIKTFLEEAEKTEGAQQAISALSSTFSSLGDAIGGTAEAWLDWIGNLLSAISQALPAIMSLTKAKKADATASAEDAGASAAASVAGIPYVGPVMAVAAIASIVAALANIPKFASGGAVYGPTLALFGEYPNASTNPEVVAPLDKISGLVAEAAGSGGGRVDFYIDGRNLHGVLQRYNNYLKRG